MNGPTLRSHRVGIEPWRENLASPDNGFAVGAPGELLREPVGGGDPS